MSADQRRGRGPPLSPATRRCWRTAVPQDRALTVQPWHAWVTRQEIRLDIPLDACQPLMGDVSSLMARAIVGDAEPFSFIVPSVFFRFDAEYHDRWPKKKRLTSVFSRSMSSPNAPKSIEKR